MKKTILFAWSIFLLRESVAGRPRRRKAKQSATGETVGKASKRC